MIRLRFSRILSVFAGLSGTALSLSCSSLEQQETAPPSPNFAVSVNVFAEGRQGVTGAQILVDNKAVGTTDAAGAVKLTFQGKEGDTIEMSVKCPAGYASPSKPIVVGLRHLEGNSKPPKYEAECTRLSHSIVVGIKAENGANLPIRRLGQVIGKTNALGVAHLLLEAAPNEQITLNLDAASVNTELRPPSVSFTFLSKDKDEEVLFEQKFTVQKRVIKHAAIKIPTPI